MREILQVGASDTFYPLGMAPDGHGLYAYSNLGRERIALVVYDLVWRKEREVLWQDDTYDLFAREERNDAIKAVSSFKCGGPLRAPLMATCYGERLMVKSFAETLRRDFSRVRKRLGNCDLALESQSEDLSRLLFMASSGRNKGAYYLYTPDIYACGISLSGMVHLGNSVRARPTAIMRERFGDPDRDEARLKTTSPFYAVDRIKAPLLLATGAKDSSIPVQDVDIFVQSLRAGGTEVDYIRYDQEGHNLLYNPALKLEIFREIEALLARCLHQAH